MEDCKLLKIGVCSPFTVSEFVSYLNPESQERVKEIDGLKAPAVDAVIHELLRRGYKVSIYSLDYSIDDYTIFKGDKLTIILAPGHCKNTLKRVLGIFTYKTSALKHCILMDSEQPNILHAHWTHEYALAALVASPTSTVAVTVRDWAPKVLRLFRKHYYFYIHYAMDYLVFHHKRACVIANSNFMAEQVLKRWKRSVPVIPNPIGSLYLNDEVKCMHDKFVIISISNNVSPLKNIANLLVAYKKLYVKYQDSIELQLLGSQFVPDNTTIVNWKQQGLLNGVVLCGFVSHKDLLTRLSMVDVMVHPSLEESFGNVLIEAMSQNILVIGGEKSGAVPSVLGYGEYGVLCDVTNSDSIANAMEDAYLHFDEYQTKIQKSLKYVREKYSVNRITDMHLEIYNKILGL